MSADLPDHVRINRTHWDATADQWEAAGARNWASPASWGIWGIPEAELGLLPTDMSGLDAIELGCGTAYVSAWMARRGARVVGIDNSARQLATAARLAREHGVELTLIHGNAEQVPLPDASFDFAISEYGAAIWCDPYRWIPEAHRLLRPGGELVFLGTSVLATLCLAPDGLLPCSERLVRDHFGLHRLEWPATVEKPANVEFNLPLSGWLRLFREVGFTVLDFQELRAPESARGQRYFVTADWARRWPAEQVWRLRK
jgi:SAM-dependent methyltransferase